MGTAKSMAETGEIPNNAGGVQLPEGNASIPAEVPAAPAAQLTVRQRIMNAQKDAATLELDADITGESQTGKRFSYKGISAAQVVARAKAVLIQHGIFYAGPDIHPETLKIDGNKVTFLATGRFENVDDSTDFVTKQFFGCGTDKADQAYAKAFTGANKQLLSKVLQLTTVEDERTEDVPHEPDAARPVREAAREDTKKALRAWASAFRTAVDKVTTLAELGKLQRDNKEQLMSEDLPEVTRDWCIDLIEQRKKLLEDDANV